MDGLICLWCGDRECEECTPSPERTKQAFIDKRFAIAALEDIIFLFKDCSEKMKDQAIRGVIAAEWAQGTLDKIKEGRNENTVDKS